VTGPEVLRRLLSRRVSIEAMVEVAIWMLVPYIAIGLGWAFFHIERVGLLQTELDTRIPAGSEIAAYLTAAALWPWEMLGAQIHVR
jgi:hypothetical protein